MGLSVTECDPDLVMLRAPLDPNTNHKCTAFGGSLYAIAVLAGWGLLWQLMKREGLAGHIVIQNSTVHYQRPVMSDLQARCILPDDEQVQQFLDTFRSKGRARIELASEVMVAGAVATTFRGRYVAHV